MDNKSILTPATAAVALTAHLEGVKASSRTGGEDWPPEAELAVIFNQSTWPCGWGKESEVAFFASEAEFEAWVEGMQDWALSEDNFFAYQLWSWDWGPVLDKHRCQNIGNLPMTYKQLCQMQTKK